jgi:hypothetical protein
MFLVELQLSIKSIDILQKADVWLLEDIIEKMNSDPTAMTLALAKINADDFVEITEAIGKRTKNVLDNP